MSDEAVLGPKNWRETELIAAGFHYYKRHKNLVMCRPLPASEAPLVIETDWDTLVAEAGHVICFEAGDTIRQSLYDYTHWPVRADHFADSYRSWNAPERELTATEQHLQSLGCAPFYNDSRVWAKKLDHEMLVQTIESAEPVTVPAGAWLCIGATGSTWGFPWSMTEAAFTARFYQVER